jgi:hypothetical protein
MTESPDRESLESRWQANERRLNEIAAMTGLGREMHSAESETLEVAQDAIEFELGTERRPGSRRCGGIAMNARRPSPLVHSV